MNSGVKSTNEELIEQIILEKYNQYYRMAYSYVKNESDAADIVQEGAYKAIKYSNQLQKTEFASTWIYRIMMNEIYRHLKIRKFESTDDENFVEPSKYDTYRDLDLQNAMEQLPEIDRAIIRLKYFEDMKLEEIAQILDENLSTIKSRLYRALKKLRISMEG